jgi:hypothetical protein
MLTTLALWLSLSQLNPYAGITWDNPMGGWLDATLYKRMWARAMNKPLDKPAPKLGLVATDFKPQQPRSVAEGIIKGSKGLGKEQGQALVEGLNAGLDAFERESRKNNVASALAFLLAVSLQTVGEKEVGDAELETLAQALNDELAASLSYRKMTPKQKQLLYETCVIVGALIGGMGAMAAEASDAAMSAQAQQLARSALAVFRGK